MSIIMTENKKLKPVHEEALRKLDRLIDPEHVARIEAIQTAAWSEEELPYLPSIVDTPVPDWPVYPFKECWDDVEKNFITGLANAYTGAVMHDDRLYTLRAEYGVVNIPELFGIHTIITNEGNSMSTGLDNSEAIRKLVDRGIPDFAKGHGRKVLDYYEYAREVFSGYENLSRFVHFVLPDTQGPFDLACLLWGSDIFVAMHDEPELVKSLISLMAETFSRYNTFMKKAIGEQMDSAYHICGLKLVRGGIRICDDSATLVSGDFYRDFIVRENEKAFAPFKGGWLHYCGNGNHLQPYIRKTAGVNVLHMGNPDMHDLIEIGAGLREHNITLYWSGSLDMISEYKKQFELKGIIVLAENRYAGKNLEDGRRKLDNLRACKPIEKNIY